MKFLIYAVGLAIVSLIIKSLQALKKKGFKTTSSILKFNFLLIIPAVLAGGFTMSRFYTSPTNAKFEKSIGASDSETIIIDNITGSHFVLTCEYSEVEFGKHFDVITSGFGDDLQVYNPKGTRMTGIIPVLFTNSFLSFWVVFIIIEGLGNYIWIRRVAHRKPAASIKLARE